MIEFWPVEHEQKFWYHFWAKTCKWYKSPRVALLHSFLLKEDNTEPKGGGDTVRGRNLSYLIIKGGNIMLTSNACLNY